MICLTPRASEASLGQRGTYKGRDTRGSNPGVTSATQAQDQTPSGFFNPGTSCLCKPRTSQVHPDTSDRPLAGRAGAHAPTPKAQVRGLKPQVRAQIDPITGRHQGQVDQGDRRRVVRPPGLWLSASPVVVSPSPIFVHGGSPKPLLQSHSRAVCGSQGHQATHLSTNRVHYEGGSHGSV